MERRRFVQLAAVSIAVLGLGVTTIGTAGAGGDAFDCAGCIDAGDVASDAIRSAEILNGSVGASDIGSGAVGTSEISNASIQPADLAASARTRIGLVTLVGSTSSTTDDTIDLFTVAVPAAGTLIVTVTGNYFIDGDAGSSAAITNSGALGLCTVPDSLDQADCGVPLFLVDSDPDSSTPDNNTPGFSLARKFSVTAGTLTLYLNGYTSDASDPLYVGPLCCGPTNAIAMFAPGSLTMSSP